MTSLSRIQYALVFPYTVHTSNPIAKQNDPLVFQHRTTNNNQCFPHFYGPTFMTSIAQQPTQPVPIHAYTEANTLQSVKTRVRPPEMVGGGDVSGLRRDSGSITFQLRLLYHCKLLSAECKKCKAGILLQSKEICKFLLMCKKRHVSFFQTYTVQLLTTQSFTNVFLKYKFTKYLASNIYLENKSYCTIPSWEEWNVPGLIVSFPVKNVQKSPSLLG